MRKKQISAFIMHFLPPSLSLLSLQEVSMATLQPGPLQPVWHSQCQLFWPMMHCPFPLHSPGQPSERGERDWYNCGIILDLRLFSLMPIRNTRWNVSRHLKHTTISTACKLSDKLLMTSIIKKPKRNHYKWLWFDCCILDGEFSVNMCCVLRIHQL